MKLLAVVLIILSERYLQHRWSLYRFDWFNTYKNTLKPNLHAIHSVWLQLFVLALVVWLPVLFIYWLVKIILWGILSWLLGLFILWYSLGPENPFYAKGVDEKELAVENYLYAVCGQLFSVLFWFFLTGAMGALFYRLIHLLQRDKTLMLPAKTVTDILDWLPIRITGLLFLVVGSFQSGIYYFLAHCISSPNQNRTFISQVGIKALADEDEKSAIEPLIRAENLVWHSVLAYLFVMAVFILLRWW